MDWRTERKVLRMPLRISKKEEKRLERPFVMEAMAARGWVGACLLARFERRWEIYCVGMVVWVLVDRVFSFLDVSDILRKELMAGLEAEETGLFTSPGFLVFGRRGMYARAKKKSNGRWGRNFCQILLCG